MSSKRYTLSKAERVKKRRYIEQLFQRSPSFAQYPYRVFYFFRPDSAEDDNTPDWQERTAEPPLQMGAGASKKNFKRANKRNRIKRLTREAFRLQKLPLLQELQKHPGLHLKVFLHFTGRELPDFTLVQQKVDAILQRLQKEIKEQFEHPA